MFVKKITEKYPSLKSVNNVIAIALLTQHILVAINVVLIWAFGEETDVPNPYYGIVFSVLVFVIIFGVYKKHRWAEVLAMIYTASIVIGFLFGLKQFVSNVLTLNIFNILTSFFVIFYTLLSLLVSVLLFKIRFERSKEMTDNFVRYK